MRRYWMRLAAATILLGQSLPAVARSYTVEDLLRSEDIGNIAFDPSGRWLVFERLEPFLAMSRFDMLARASVLRSRLYRVALDGTGRSQPLLRHARPGEISYGFSPDGRRLAIGQLAHDRWRLGIVTLRSGAVRWFDLSPDYDPFRTSVRWITSSRLVAIVDPSGERPWWLRSDAYPADALPSRWRATRQGHVAAVTAVGSGRFRDRGKKAPRSSLVMIDAVNGAVTRLATGRFRSLDLSPDLNRVAVIEQGGRVGLPQHRPVSQIDAPDAQRLMIYDLRLGRSWRPCGGCDMLGNGQWSADGHTYAAFARLDGEDWSEGRIVAIDVDRHALKRPFPVTLAPIIADMPDGSTRVPFHWRGSTLLLYARSASSPATRPEWYAAEDGHTGPLTVSLPDVTGDLTKLDRCAAAMQAQDGIWCLDTPTPSHMFDATIVPSNGRGIGWHRIGDRIVIDGEVLSGRTIMIDPRERIESIEAAPTADALVVRKVADDGVKTLILLTRNQIDTIAVANRHLRDVQPAHVRPLVHHLSDGRQVTSWLYLPPSMPGGKLPLVVIPYPGAAYGNEPAMAQSPGAARFYTNAQILAGRGYAVLLPSLPLRSDDFDHPYGVVDDVEHAVDAAVATQMIDKQRIALWGHSYGGYAATLIAERSCRFAAAITSAGIYDPAAVVGTFGPTMRLAPERGLPIGQYYAWAETGQGRLGVPPWKDPARYVAANLLYRADRIMVPMLIIAADRDPSPVEQAQQLFAALSRQNKDAELVTYWGEGHVIGSPANVRDMYTRLFDFLATAPTHPHPARCAQGETPPIGSATPAPSAP